MPPSSTTISGATRRDERSLRHSSRCSTRSNLRVVFTHAVERQEPLAGDPDAVVPVYQSHARHQGVRIGNVRVVVVEVVARGDVLYEMVAGGILRYEELVLLLVDQLATA